MTHQGYSTKVRQPSTAYLLTAILLLQSFPATAADESIAPAQSISIQVIEGQGAINNVKRGTAFEPVVEVRDQQGSPVAGASVVFTLPSVGPGGSFPDGSKTLMTRTDENGRATARGMRPNAVAGQFDIRVKASYAGQSTTTTFAQTNAAPATAERSSAKKWFVVMGLAGGAAAAGIFAAHGGSTTKTTVNSDPASGSVTPGTPGFGPPR